MIVVVFRFSLVKELFWGKKRERERERTVLFSLVGKVKEFSNILIIYFTLINIYGSLIT